MAKKKQPSPEDQDSAPDQSNDCRFGLAGVEPLSDSETKQLLRETELRFVGLSDQLNALAEEHLVGEPVGKAIIGLNGLLLKDFEFIQDLHEGGVTKRPSFTD